MSVDKVISLTAAGEGPSCERTASDSHTFKMIIFLYLSLNESLQSIGAI